MTAATLIASLDAQLAARGRTVTLRRLGSPNVDVALKAHVRKAEAMPLNGDILDTSYKVIVSPTGLGTWPTGSGQTVPRNASDQVLIDNKAYQVIDAKPVHVADTLVRVEMTCGIMRSNRG